MAETALDRARLAMETALPTGVEDGKAMWLQLALLAILDHLEEQEASRAQPASETSSAPTTGPASKPSELPRASLAYDQGQFHLTVQTSVYSKSMSFTEHEWEAIQGCYSMLKSTSGLPTPSTEIKAGDRGPVSLEEEMSARQKCAALGHPFQRCHCGASGIAGS